LPDHGIIDPSRNSARTPGHHRTFSSARRRFAKGARDHRKPAPRCRTSTAGLPTNPENNYHSAVQPENTGRMVNRLPGRKPMTAVAFTINGKAVSVEAEPEGAFSPSVSEAYWGDVIPDTYQTAKEFIDSFAV